MKKPVVVTVCSFLTVLTFAASPAQAAAVTPAATRPKVIASQANASLPHAAPTKGKCRTGFSLARAKTTHTITLTSGRKVQLRKGSLTCIRGAKALDPGTKLVDGILVNSRGEAVLPANFPKQPTVADIQTLGWTGETKVDPKLVNSQFGGISRPLTPVTTKTPPKVTLVSASGSGDVVDAVWRVQGGSGVLHAGGKYIKLTGDTFDISTRSETISHTGSNDLSVMFGGFVQDDYGQSKMALDLADQWDLPVIRVTGGSGLLIR